MVMKRYIPLFMLIVVAALGALALSYRMPMWMPFFMGMLLCQFALLKLFHLGQFANGFQKYDFIGKRSSHYSYLYPFIELGLGLGYLSGFKPFLINIITIIVTTLGAFGVIQALRKGLDVRCACMGTILDVPLSTVTLTEDIGMGLMAFLMLFF